MRKLVIRTNTLPYIHKYSIIDEATGEVMGNYKTMGDAKNAQTSMGSGAINPSPVKTKDNMDRIEALEKRMQRPDGDRSTGDKAEKIRRIRLD